MSSVIVLEYIQIIIYVKNIHHFTHSDDCLGIIIASSFTSVESTCSSSFSGKYFLRLECSEDVIASKTL